MNGITILGKHSWHTFRLRMLERSISDPVREEHREKVAYSNITHNFDTLYGAATYANRTLRYKFELRDPDLKRLERRHNAVVNWLQFGETELYDDFIDGYHFQVFPPKIETENAAFCVKHITVTFEAYPFRISNERKKYPPDLDRFPDVNLDGRVTADDVSEIMQAVVNQIFGESTGLSPEQELRADADRDGEITTSDASLVMKFISTLLFGEYEASPEGWAKFLNDKQPQKEEVL